MEKKELLEQVGMLRTLFKASPRLRLEFLGMLSQLLRQHSVDVQPELLSHLSLAVDEEITGFFGPEPQIDP